MDSRAIVPQRIEAPPERRGKRIDLRLDPNAFARPRNDEPFPQSASPASSLQSPIGTPNHRSRRAHDVGDTGNTTSSQSPSPYTAAGAKADREKRKRSRVTPDQLVHLERFFASDRSPTASRRREISELLGMQERQTQIWFQNRRAKAKLQDGKQKVRGISVETPPDTPPELSTGMEAELQNLLHEAEPVTIIPCTDLSIGTWRRIATTVGKHDLVAYVCEARRCFTWFIHSDGYGFKMEVSFDSILDAEFSNATPGFGLASFFLSRPPLFYLEHVSSPGADGSVTRHWKRCADWTEGQQASKILRHDVTGSAVQLAHLLKNMRVNNANPSVHLHPPPYTRTHLPQATIELPQQHETNTLHAGLHRDEAGSEGPVRRRSLSGPPSLSLACSRETSTVPYNKLMAVPLSTPFPSTPYTQTSSQAVGMEVSQAIIANFPTAPPNFMRSQPFLDGYGTSRPAVPRTYAVPSALPFEQSIPDSFYTMEGQFSVPETPLSHSPSPTLLHTPQSHGYLSTSSSPQTLEAMGGTTSASRHLPYETDSSV